MKYIVRAIFLLTFVSNYLQAISITWIAPTPSDDMQDASNWSPSTVPGTSDTAIFDSSLSGVSTTPTESSAPFAASSFNFPNLASPFTFSFNNQNLTFSGLGITGVQTNPSFSFINTNNSTYLGDMFSFSSFGTTGSSVITSVNSALASGSAAGESIGAIGSQFHAVGSFIISDNASISLSNIGHDTTTGTGNNSIGVAGATQLKFDDDLTVHENVTFSVANSGTLSGSNSTTANTVGLINGSQFGVTNAFLAGDNFSCTVENSGNNSNTGIGNNFIGVLNAAQVNFGATGIVGDNASITVTNTGINSSQATVGYDQTAYLNDYQFYAAQQFQAGDNFNFTVSNTGTDTSTGIGQGPVAVINSNSGTSGNQALFLQGAILGDDAAFTISNDGTYEGTNTVSGCQVAGMNLGQLGIGDLTSIGSYYFTAQDNFSLTVSNSGTNSAIGTGGDSVGSVSTDQVALYASTSLGDQAHITISSEGQYTGTASTTYVNIGSTGARQIAALSTFESGDNFVLNISNAGTNEGSGIGGFFIGDIITGQQAYFDQGLTTGDNSSITISNSGTNSASTTNNNQVGSLMGYGSQFLVKEGLSVGDNFSLRISNTGLDSSTGHGGNFVGFMNNNTVDYLACQAYLFNGGTVGDNASFTISNTGTFQGNNTGTNLTAVLSGSQFASSAPFIAGDQLTFNVSTIGTNNGSGQDSNNVGVLGGTGACQIDFRDSCTVGSDTSFVISNSGVNNDATGINNNIGYIANAQMNVLGNFSAGANLIIDITNSAVNAGDGTNSVGHVIGNQLSFAQGCSLQSGSTISVTNSGTVDASQILFGQGFNVVSGSSLIQVTNEGTIGDYGIEIEGSNAGGNAQISLTNSSLYVATTLPTFTIAGLEGDGTSMVQSLPTLIINQDNDEQSTFTGVVQDFSGSDVTAVTKTGSGIQILSGNNTYSGLTTVEQGTLVVNGGLAGNANVQAGATLGGNVTFGGSMYNYGTISPGNSIGTMHTTDLYLYPTSFYNVEVNSAGASDLVAATGIAQIDGGIVITPDDYNFTAPVTYTVITADSGVTGTFSSFIGTVPALKSITYNPTSVQINYLPIQSIGLTSNALNAANGYTSLEPIPGTDVAKINNTLLTLSFDELENAFNQMSGGQFAGPGEVQLLDALLVRSTYTKHLQKYWLSQNQCCDKPVNLWFDGFAQWQDQDDALGYHDVTVGATASADFCINNWVLGFAISGTHDDFQWSYTRGNAYMNSGYVGLYSRLNHDNFYMNLAILGAYNSYDTLRDINFSTIHRRAVSNHNGGQLLTHASLGYWLTQSYFDWSPYVNVDYVYQHENGFTESGAQSLNLQVNSKNSGLVQSEFGITFQKSYQGFTPMVTLAYVNQTQCLNKNYYARFVDVEQNDISDLFAGRGYYNRNLFTPRLGCLFNDICDKVTVSLFYDAQVGSSYWAQDLVFDLTICF